jgi:hypothetical protein
MNTSHTLRGLLGRGLITALLAIGLGAQASAQGRTLYGFTPFPYDATPEAVARVAEILRDHTTVHAVHMDDGIPWQEMLDKEALPKRVQKEWDELLRAVPRGRPIYLGLAPLAKDRTSLAPTRGERDGEAPRDLRRAALDDPRVKEAYLEYARRAVRHFKPAYLNLGIESGELASRDARRWPQFEGLYRHVAQALKQEFPNLPIGISFGLQGLRKPEVAERARGVVDASDYVCVSFYPHASPFHERFGDPPLGAGEASWREPLQWLRDYTNKPLAVCETGHLTSDAELRSYKFTMRGTPDLQQRYMRELAQFAKRDNYLFVIWFLAVDYDKLFERMRNSPGNEVNLLWRNIGLFDGNVQPKPAWAEWQRAVAGRVDGLPPAAAGRSPEVAAVARTSGNRERAAPRNETDLAIGSRLFNSGPGGKAEAAGGGMLWSFEYPRREWAWAMRDLGVAVPASATRMNLRVRSDRPGALFVQLEENNGQTFFAIVEPREDWSDISIELKSLSADPAKRKDGVLRPERLSKLLIADPAGKDAGARGRRNLWIERWTFD